MFCLLLLLFFKCYRTKQNTSAFWASGNHFISFAFVRSNWVGRCTETWFLTFLRESCLILNKLLDFCFWLFFLKATWPWTSCFSFLEPQFVLYVRRAGPVNLEVPESEKSMVVTLFAFILTPLFIMLVFIALCRPCIFFLNKLKVCGKSIQASLSHFSSSIWSLHVSVSHFSNPHSISNICIVIIFVIVICD